MHISDGVLSPAVLAVGTIIAASGVAVGLKKISYREMPTLAVLTSVFFVASLIHIPLGPAGAHLILNGLAGIILGWGIFPALFMGLLLQAMLFSHGGITTVGVNTLNMALPGFLCWKLFPLIKNKQAGGFIAGFGGVAGSVLMLWVSLGLSRQSFIPAATIIAAGHIPVAIAEGLVTAAAVVFLMKTSPELIGSCNAS